MKIILVLYDQFRDYLREIYSSLKTNFSNFWSGSYLRRLFDLVTAFSLAYFIAPVAVGLAAANFLNCKDTAFVVIFSVFVSMFLLSISFWFIEIIAFLAAFQITNISKKFLVHYAKHSTT